MNSKLEYEAEIKKTRDARMEWWREARFGMFVHYGLYSQLGTHEWSMSLGNYEVEEYEKFADTFGYVKGSAKKWAVLAKNAGMKYVVLTTRHHEGFSLWDSKANPYNSVNFGPKIDIVREFVDACRENDLRIGFYSTLMDWHHPDSWKCAFDTEARKRFTDYIKDINRELMTNYGKIDILWYDVPEPMESWEGWDSLELNKMVRALQPDIIINDRSRLDEDFGTPEENIVPVERDWEACMTFNGLSWGYLDEKQTLPYSYTPNQILRMLSKVTYSGGNLLLNVGPRPDGGVPDDAIKPLEKVGRWLKENGEAAYGKMDKSGHLWLSGICDFTIKDVNLYAWDNIWPPNGVLRIGGIVEGSVIKAELLSNGSDVDFEQVGQYVLLKNLPKENPDKNVGTPVFKLVFDKKPKFVRCSYFPQINNGVAYR